MHIKPAVVTGTAAVVALAAVLVVTSSTTPTQASGTLIGCFWVALFLTIWGVVSTAILLMRQTLSRAVWAGCIVSGAVITMLVLLQRGML